MSPKELFDYYQRFGGEDADFSPEDIKLMERIQDELANKKAPLDPS